MASIFKPNEMLKTHKDFNVEEKRNLGFNTILLDVDNTIAPYYEKIPGKEAIEFVKKLEDAGFRVIVFSNNTDKRVKEVAKVLNCDYYPWALKPLPFKFFKVIKEYKLDKEKVICMGDQLMTDILGGNSAGVYTIYVKPISEVDSWTTKINRKMERFVFKHILHEEV